jgi:hypothetical protein
MRKGPQKPDNDSSRDKISTEGIDLDSASDGNDGVGDMNAVIEYETETAFSLNEDADWSLTGIINHPSGVDFALQQNLALMEKQTKELIENGSVEDLLAALEENTRQLQMLQTRMEGRLNWLSGS